jgi:hypothetical protein
VFLIVLFSRCRKSRERDHWTRMRRSLVRFSDPAS